MGSAIERGHQNPRTNKNEKSVICPPPALAMMLTGESGRCQSNVVCTRPQSPRMKRVLEYYIQVKGTNAFRPQNKLH